MEFELERMQFQGYDAQLDTTVFHEETMESIVTDACPDILRIIETDGKVIVQDKSCSEGRISVNGVMRLSVLYLPEDEAEVRHLDVDVPFTCGVDAPGIDAGCSAVIAARLHSADARALNPRKILVRAEAAVDISGYARTAIPLCTGIAQDGGDIQQLIEAREVCLTGCIREKPFTIHETIPLTSGRPSLVELLKSGVVLRRGGAKVIGGKLIIKGTAQVTALCRGIDGKLYTVEHELPYSQIMEVSGVTEDAECDLTFALTRADISLTSDMSAEGISVELEVLAQAILRESRELPILEDAYSIRGDIQVEQETYALERRFDSGTRTQSYRESWEAPTRVREIISCRLSLGDLAVEAQGERTCLSASVNIDVLYRDEDGQLFSQRHSMSAPCQLESAGQDRYFCHCYETGEVAATSIGAEIEVRFELDFCYYILSRQQLRAVTQAAPSQCNEADAGAASLILRALEPEERLWDIAKLYQTTVDDIMQANDLPDASAAAGKLLLIPRKR